MLTNAPAAATIAVRDLDAAKKFYTDTLGLTIARDDSPGAIFFESGGSTILLYARPTHEPSAATIASFRVDDVASTVGSLRGRGVTFEEYDFDQLKTVNGVATLPNGSTAAWFKDPDGNIIALGQM